MAKYKLTWKDLSLNDFKIYFFALFKAFIPKKKINNFDEFENFIQSKSAWVSSSNFVWIFKNKNGHKICSSF